MALWKAKVPLKTVREQCKVLKDQRIKEIKRLWIIKIDNSKYLILEAHGQYAQEAAGGYCKAGCLL